MKFLEKNLEDILFDGGLHELLDRGIEVYGEKRRQYRVGNYGIIDLVTMRNCKDHEGRPFTHITIFELKKDKIGISALLQAFRYAKGIQRIFDKAEAGNYNIDIKLVGKTIDMDGSLIYIPELIRNSFDIIYATNCVNNIQYFTYTYEIDGIRFKEINNYCLVNEGFKNNNK